MEFDIYRRPEPGDRVSFLAVPAGRPIPAEATGVEWIVHARAVPLDQDAPRFDDYRIDAPARQLRDKGYAITRLADQPAA